VTAAKPPAPTPPARVHFYKRNPSEFFSSTFDFPWELKVVYGLVLDLIYLDQGSTPDDAQRIATMLGNGMTVRRWNMLRADLIARGKIEVINGRLFNGRATREFLRQGRKPPGYTENTASPPEIIDPKNAEKIEPKIDGKNLGDLLAANGLVENGAPPGPGEKPRFTPSPAPVRREVEVEVEIESTVVVIQNVEKIAEALGQARGKYWEADYRRMTGEGLTFEAILEAAKAHRGDPLRGLSALRGLAARKQQDLDWKGKKSSPGGIVGTTITSASHSELDWEKALGVLLRFGAWVASEYGPPPTRPGHVVPPGPYAKWKALWDRQGQHPLDELDASSNRVKYPAENPNAWARSLWEPQA
jgi:hypothetical protein